MDGKAQLGGKPQAPQNPQGVLGEAAGRLPHAAEQPGGQILLAVEQIHQAPLGMPGHGVDGEIPAGKVVLQAAGKGHGIRVAAVGIGPVAAEGGDFNGVVPGGHPGDGAVGRAGLHQALPGKAGLCLLGQGAGGDVPVRGRLAQQGIPHAAPHAPGPEAPGLQAAEGLPYHGGRHNGQSLVHSNAPSLPLAAQPFPAGMAGGSTAIILQKPPGGKGSVDRGGKTW